VSQPAPRPGTRAERTRAAILAAAEQIFAERGFAAARLEDVAEVVGIRRASIVYHFRDKRELYEAVLASVVGDFRPRLEAALAGPGTLSERIEAAVGAWVDYVAERPALARILLREVADASRDHPPAVVAAAAPFVELVERFRAEMRDDPLALARPIDPVHLASAIVGTTVFFVAGMPALVPEGFDPLSAPHLASHREEVLRLTRRLLGAPGPRPLRRTT
jgi:TetR/AcrR family transcriptional regulator